MPESWKTRLARFRWNVYPTYRGSGGRIAYIAGDWREVQVEIPFSWRTRNYVGTTYGGSIYGAVDPIYMMMLIHTLGPDYVVWDKAATVRFRRPGRSPLQARFVLTEEELSALRAELESRRSLDRVYRVEITDRRGVLHAEVEKTLYVARKREKKLSLPAG